MIRKYDKRCKMRDASVEFAVSAERVYKTFLDLLRYELDIANVNDINSMQTFIILNIDENTVSMSELISRGYYIGSNASYNLKKMINYGYLGQSPSNFDKRSSLLKLTRKGSNLLNNLKANIATHLIEFEKYGENECELEKITRLLKSIDHFWRGIITNGR